MSKRTYDLGEGGYSSPATETIDESLARLARQDTRLNADGAIIGSTDPAGRFAALQQRAPAVLGRVPGIPARQTPAPPPYRSPTAQGSGFLAHPTPVTTSRTARSSRTGVLSLVRWVIVLGATWLFWRYFLRG